MEEVGQPSQRRHHEHSEIVLKRCWNAKARLPYNAIMDISQPKYEFGEKMAGSLSTTSLYTAVAPMFFGKKREFCNRVRDVMAYRKIKKRYHRKVAQYYFAHIWVQIV